jgi:excisionase family DNA binding protein
MALEEYTILKKVCDILGVSKDTIFRLNEEKKLPLYKFRGNWYAKKDEVEKVLIKGCQGCK